MDSSKYSQFTNNYNKLVKLIYKVYRNRFIKKSIKNQDIPSKLINLIYNIHELYLTSNIYTSTLRISSFLKQMNSDELVYITIQIQNLQNSTITD